MSTLKLTVASTLIGTTLLVTGLLVATSVADEGTERGAAVASVGNQAIDTSVAESPDDQQPEQTLELPSTDQQRRQTRVYILTNLDPEDTRRLLEELYGNGHESDTDSEDARSRTLSIRSRGNSLIMSADPERLDEIGNLLRLLDESTANALRKRIDDAGNFLNEFDESTERNPVAPADGGSITAAAPTEGDDSSAEFRLYGSIRGRIFKLRNADAASAVKLLSGFIDADGRRIAGVHSDGPLVLSSDADSNSVIAAGDEKKLKVVETMLSKLDQQIMIEPERVSDDPNPNIPTYAAPAQPQRPTRPALMARFSDSVLTNVDRAISHFDLTKRSPAEQRLRQALQSFTVPAFDDLPLYNAIYMLSEEHDFQFFVDEAALEGADISIHDVPVTLNLSNSPSLRDDVTVESVLELLFQQVTTNAPDAANGVARVPAQSTEGYKLGPGDVLGVYIEDILGSAEQGPPVHFPEDGGTPAIGYPIQVSEEGTLRLPLVPPIEVAGLTLSEATERVRQAYSTDRQILPKGKERILISFIKRRENEQVDGSDNATSLKEFGFSPLTYLVKEGLLIITTREVAEQTMQVRTYNLRPLNEEGNRIQIDTVVDAIRTLAGETTWIEQGGRGAVVQGVDTLTIRQSPLVHRDIERLLEHFLHVAERSGESSY